MKDDFSHKEEALKESQRVARLIAGFIQQDLSEEEQEALDGWVGVSDENMKLFEELTDEKNIDKSLEWFNRLDTEQSLEKVKARIQANTYHTKNLFRNYWMYAAAAIVIIVAGGVYYMDTGAGKPSVSVPVIIAANDDLQPGVSKAVLLTGNGGQVDLSASSDSVIRIEGNIAAHNSGTMLSYSADIKSNQAVSFNTLKTPAGGEYQVRLPDGSRVWLNAASSLTYPTMFTAATRTVELSGEGYFEVAKNEEKPFIVKTSTVDVQVLGTHFNVKAYKDEESVMTTLLEGLVKINSGNTSALLNPGQQAISDRKDIKVVNKEDVEEVVAWKNGLFSFNRDSIQTVMSQIARWYNIDVVYQSKINHLFTGRIYRNSTASQVFRLLEVSGDVHFKVEGRSVMVTP